MPIHYSSAPFHRAFGWPLWSSHRVNASEIQFVVMISGSLTQWEKMQKSWANPDSGLNIWYYATRPMSTTLSSVIPLEVYASKIRKIEKCCSRRYDLITNAQPFFCQTHNRNTIRYQHLYIKALKHAKHYFSKKWLVLLEEDTWVNVARLTQVLYHFPHHKAIHLGEYAFPTYNSTHIHSPYYCGGAGSILSAKAVRVFDPISCERHSLGKCMQSDWILAECFARSHRIQQVNIGCESCFTQSRTPTSVASLVLRQGRCFVTQRLTHRHDIPLFLSSLAFVHTQNNRLPFPARCGSVQDAHIESLLISPFGESKALQNRFQLVKTPHFFDIHCHYSQYPRKHRVDATYQTFYHPWRVFYSGIDIDTVHLVIGNPYRTYPERIDYLGYIRAWRLTFGPKLRIYRLDQITDDVLQPEITLADWEILSLDILCEEEPVLCWPFNRIQDVHSIVNPV